MANFKILLEGIGCARANDPGTEVEVFCTIGGVDGKGVQTSSVFPGDGAGDQGDHWWNIHEQSPDRILNAWVWKAPMDPGETTLVGLTFIDAGNGSDLNNAVSLAAQAMGAAASNNNNNDPDQSGGGLLQTIATIVQVGASIFTSINPDKVRGSVTIKAKNDNGILKFAAEGAGGAACSRLNDGGWPGIGIHMPEGDFSVYLRFSLA